MNGLKRRDGKKIDGGEERKGGWMEGEASTLGIHRHLVSN